MFYNFNTDGEFILRTPRYIHPESITVNSIVPEVVAVTTDTNQNNILVVQNDVKAEENVSREIKTEVKNRSHRKGVEKLVSESITESKSDNAKESITVLNEDILDKAAITCDTTHNQNIIKSGSKTGIINDTESSDVTGNKNTATCKKPPLGKHSSPLVGDNAFKTFKHHLQARREKPENNKKEEGNSVEKMTPPLRKPVTVTNTDVKHAKEISHGSDNDSNKTRQSSQDIYTCEERGNVQLGDDLDEKQKVKQDLLSEKNNIENVTSQEDGKINQLFII